MSSLGSKESFYLDLVRDAWSPLLKQREVRQAIFTTVVGFLIVTVGGAALFVVPDIGPFFAGFFVLGWGGTNLWQRRHLYRAWRQIGDVHLEFEDGALIAGEAGTIEIVVVPRRAGTIASASLTLWAKDSRGPAATGTTFTTGLVFDVPLPADPALVAGTESRLPIAVALDPSAPPSHFDSDYTRQWHVTASLALTDGRTWTREYPLLVYPGVLLPTAMPVGGALE